MSRNAEQAHLFHAPAMPPDEPYLLHRADAVDMLAGLPDESVDLIVTDPAYESLEKYRRVGTTTRLTSTASSPP